MNIAIEYMLREKRIQNLLTLPCALFLENTITKSKKKRKRSSPLSGKIVVVLTEITPETVHVKQYKLHETNKEKSLPPYVETVIMRSEVFNHPDVIIPNFKLIEFIEEPYDTPQKHYSELPHAPLQEKDYKESREKFFNPKVLQRQREDWLWKAFEKIYGDQTERATYRSMGFPALERENVRVANSKLQKQWGKWCETFLSFKGPAPELTFAHAFKSAFLKLEVKEALPLPEIPSFFDEPMGNWDHP